MLLLESILAVALSQAAPATENNGYLGGVVVRASDGQAVAGAEVILSIRHQTEFLPAAKTVADENGKFIFEELPVAPHVIYRLGANWGDIHYPGPVTRLVQGRSTVGVKLTVNEAVTEPNLLLARRHEITIRSKPGMLEVSELLVVENPSLDCYVGKPHLEGGEPETLCLNIPQSFEQITFDDEFYGRRFSLNDGRLVTGIPWTPGERELRFTYVLANEQRQLTWIRPLDLSCGDVMVRVVTDRPQDVSCSLAMERKDESGGVVFQYSGPDLEAGREIRVGLGRTAVSPLAYGKWLAATLLVVLVILGTFWRRSRRTSAKAPSAGLSSEPRSGPHTSSVRTRGRKGRSIGTRR